MNQSDALTDALAGSLAAGLAARGLAAPALLYLAGHRPLAFAAGNLLAVAAPTAAVLGLPRLMEWARLLTSPAGVEELQRAIARHSDPAEARRSGNLPDGAGEERRP